MIPVFVAYFVLTLVLGLWQARRTKSQSDFVLGGKRLPGWMLALSERATGESAWLLLVTLLTKKDEAPTAPACPAS